MNTQGRIGSGWNGGSAENIVITGDAVVDANGGIGGGYGDGKTSITISGNAKVTATDKAETGAKFYGGSTPNLAVIGSGGGTAEITISGNAVVNAKAENRGLNYYTGAVIGGGSGYNSNQKSSAKVTIEDNAQVTAENSEHGIGAGIGAGACGTGEVIIGGKAQVKATGSAEYQEGSFHYGAGAAIGDSGTAVQGSGTAQNGENKFITADDIQDGAKVEMTNIGHNSSNTVTKTRRNGDWVTEGDEEQTPEEPQPSQEELDQAAADEVAAMIDAIYVQERTDETDAQCEAAKAAWDALTDAQKELVEGDEASPDYFGLDTGDASLDDARNQDEIGENELLVVSFGTSYNDSRVADIKGIEDALQAAYPDWSVRRAFTAQIIINHVQARDGEKIDNMTQALDRAVANGVKNLVVQPTHLMHGAEYDEMCEAIEQYKDKFESVSIAEPLLGEVGSDATVINADKEAVAKAITAAAVADAGFESLDAAKDAGTAFVFMGHGTAHVAKVTYSQMQTQMQNLGYENVFIGTVEGEPEETACEAVIEAVKAAGYTNVILRPLMVVAGDHANNDMAGAEEDSWKTMFEAAGFTVDCQIHGLGEIADVQALYVAHTKAAIDSLNA